MGFSSKLLLLVSVVFIHMLFAIAMLQARKTVVRWVLVYLITVALYGALYFRRWLWVRHHQRSGIYRGLGYTAAVLGALLSALFFFCVATWKALPLTILVWLVLAVAAYFLYRLTVLHLDEVEEEEEALLPLRPFV